MTDSIIKKYNIRAKKALGQNFLVNDSIVTKISQVISPNGRNIIEVWPWYWALTEKLCKENPSALELVELDKDMIEILEDRISHNDFGDFGHNIKINNIDVLKYSPPFENYDVIANIPYYITSPILRHFLYDSEKKTDNMVILMQKDVWDKILKKKKNKNSVLSLFIEKKADVSEEIFVAPGNFVPPPKVDSSVLLFKSHWKYEEVSDEEFLNLIHKAFSEPRKKTIKNLEKGGFDKPKMLEIFQRLEISENARAEEINLETWLKILELY